MPNNNPYYVPKLPDTATVSYFDVETGQNLTAEEWKQLHPEVNPSEVRIINKGEVYHSWKAGVDFPAYGPMPAIDEATALIVAQSQVIMDEMRRDYPRVVQLLNYNRAGVIEFLHAEGGLTAIEVVHNFDVSHSGSWDGPKVWSQYKDEINYYVNRLCRQLTDQSGTPILQEQLRPAREALSNHIHKEYYNKLPRWPAPYSENTERLEIAIGGSYRSGAYYIVWGSYGFLTVTDENRGWCDFKARFTGELEMKVLVINTDHLAALQRHCEYDLERGKRFIDSEQSRNRNRGLQFSWERRYLSFEGGNRNLSF